MKLAIALGLLLISGIADPRDFSLSFQHFSATDEEVIDFVMRYVPIAWRLGVSPDFTH